MIGVTNPRGRPVRSIKRKQVSVWIDEEDLLKAKILDIPLQDSIRKLFKGLLEDRAVAAIAHSDIEAAEIKTMRDRANELERKRIQKEESMDRVLKEEMDKKKKIEAEKTKRETLAKELISEYNNFNQIKGINPLTAYEKLTDVDMNADELFEQDLITYLTNKGLPGNLNLLREMIKKPQKITAE